MHTRVWSALRDCAAPLSVYTPYFEWSSRWTAINCNHYQRKPKAAPGGQTSTQTRSSLLAMALFDCCGTNESTSQTFMHIIQAASIIISRPVTHPSWTVEPVVALPLLCLLAITAAYLSKRSLSSPFGRSLASAFSTARAGDSPRLQGQQQ